MQRRFSAEIQPDPDCNDWERMEIKRNDLTFQELLVDLDKYIEENWIWENVEPSKTCYDS
jgi:hypothetical protein